VGRASCSTLARNPRSCGRDLLGVGLIATSSSDVHRGGRHQTGSRRAATGARRDPKTCHQTVTDRDRDSTRRESQPGVSHASSPVLNTTQFLALRPSADLARRSPARLDVGLAMIASGEGLEFCCYSERSAVAGCRRLAAQAGTVATRLAARTVPAAVAIRGRAGTTGPASTPI
jgi:hypothetical protein